jgi:hypothetical protein
MFAFPFRTPLREIPVDLFAELRAPFQGNKAERAYRDAFKISFFFSSGFHAISPCM